MISPRVLLDEIKHRVPRQRKVNLTNGVCSGPLESQPRTAIPIPLSPSPSLFFETSQTVRSVLEQARSNADTLSLHQFSLLRGQ